jgi:Flp pilus assembly protein TadG
MFRFLRRILNNCAGNTGIIFAIAAVPLCVSVGVAVDYSRANQAQAVLQGAADAAALAAISKINMPRTDVEKVVMDFLAANGAFDAIPQGSSVDINYSFSNGKVTVDVSGQVGTSLMKLAGIPTMTVNGYSEVQAGSSALDMVLVLDNTASMSDENRIDDLKVASKALIDEVYKNATTRTDVRIGIVPFGQYVNVGMANRNAPWIDVPADTTDANDTCWPTYPDAKKSNCQMVTKHGTSDGVPVSWDEEQCDWDLGAAVQQCTKLKKFWEGCVGSRDNVHDTLIDQTGFKYTGVLNDEHTDNWDRVRCPSEISALTNDTAKLKNQINGMTTAGDTYIPSGLVWGWNVIDPDAPYSHAPAGGSETTRALLLMTDGANTRSPTYPLNDGWDKALANQKTRDLCNNIKAQGIRVYTVAFKVIDQTGIDLLRECASLPEYAFDAANKTALVNSFTEIARSVATIHIAK